jgi:hypothetical protein
MLRLLSCANTGTQPRAIARHADSVHDDSVHNPGGKPDEGLITAHSQDTLFSIFTGISNPSVLRGALNPVCNRHRSECRSHSAGGSLYAHAYTDLYRQRTSCELSNESRADKQDASPDMFRPDDIKFDSANFTAVGARHSGDKRISGTHIHLPGTYWIGRRRPNRILSIRLFSRSTPNIACHLTQIEDKGIPCNRDLQRPETDVPE